MAKRTLYQNAVVHTGDDDCPVAIGFVVEDGRFVEILTAPALKLRGDASPIETVDLKGKVVLPGLVETHGHLFLTGLQQLNVDLRRARSFAEVVALVQHKSKTLPAGTWVVGEGWNESQWGGAGLPGAVEFEQLSAALPEHPVYLTRIDWHAALVNRRGFAQAHAASPLDEQGGATGLLIDLEMEKIQRAIPPPSRGDLEQALTQALKQCAQLGITSFHECGSNAQEIEVFEQFRTEGRLTCRLHVMVDGTKPVLRDAWLGKPPRGLSPDGLLQVRAVKMFADGALGSRGALLFEAYADADTCGIEIAKQDELFAVGQRALEQGYQVATHAIGDRAGHVVLAAYEQVFAGGSRPDLRWRLEHAQMLIPDDVKKMARLGIIASVQCSHCVSDSSWAQARLGAMRLQDRAYRWQSLLTAGVRVINGSDTPIEPLGPFIGMQAAVTRGGVKGPEVMTRRQALAAMTSDGAWAAFMDHEIGSISEGKRADFIVLGKDPLSCSEEDIARLVVEQTYLGGEEIYRLHADQQNSSG